MVFIECSCCPLVSVGLECLGTLMHSPSRCSDTLTHTLWRAASMDIALHQSLMPIVCQEKLRLSYGLVFCFMAHHWSREAVVLICFAYSHNILSEDRRLYNMMYNLWLGFKFRNTGEILETLDCFSYSVAQLTSSLTWDGLAADHIFNALVKSQRKLDITEPWV